jgi:signal transduction histidine kinase
MPAGQAPEASSRSQETAASFARYTAGPHHPTTPSPTTGAPAEKVGILVAVLAGGLASLAVAGAVLRPSQAATLLLFGSLAITLGTAIVLALKLRRERALAAAVATRIENLEDELWESEEAKAGVPTGGIASGFEPALSIATVSRELRAPLHGLEGRADLLTEIDPPAE